MNNSQTYTRKKSISRGGIYIGSYFIRDTMDAINNLEQRINYLQRRLKKPDSDVLYYAIEAGLNVIEKRLEDSGEISEPEFGTEEYEDWAVWKKNVEISKIQAKRERYIKIYEELGRESFIEWAADNGINTDDFFAHYKDAATELKQSDLDKNFLERFLSNKIDIPVSEVKNAALIYGIIHMDNNELIGWDRLEKTAERYGYKGPRHGYWQDCNASTPGIQRFSTINQ